MQYKLTKTTYIVGIRCRGKRPKKDSKNTFIFIFLFSQGGQLAGPMPVLAACHLIYICSVVLHYIAIHVVVNKVLSLSLCHVNVVTQTSDGGLLSHHNVNDGGKPELLQQL